MQSGSKTSEGLAPSDPPREEKEAPLEVQEDSRKDFPEEPQETEEPQEMGNVQEGSVDSQERGAEDEEVEGEVEGDPSEDQEEGHEESMEDPQGDREVESLDTRSELEVVSGCKRRIKASVPAEKVQKELDFRYDDLIKTVQLPGFRRGRVPRRLLEARFGDKIEGEVKEALLSVSLGEVVAEKALRVVGSPKFDHVQFGKDSDLTYEAEVELWPEFELGEYKGIEVEREVFPLRDEQVEEQLKFLQQKRARGVRINPEDARPDDIFAGKYHLYRNDSRVKTSDSISFTPSTKLLHIFYLEDLPDRVKAWQPGSGEPLRLRVKVPEAFSDEVLRGVEVDLEFVLEETQRLEYPELDDSFAQSFQKGSLSELREEIRESLESRRRRREEARIEEKVLEKIIAAASMDLPESLLESQKKRWVLENELKLLREEGLSLEEAKQRLLSVGETAEEELRRGLKAFFILEKIAAKEKIYVTEEELNERLDLLATYYGVPVHKLREEMRKTGRLEELRHSLRQEKVQALLREGAKITGEVAQEAARNAATDPAEGPVEGADLTPGGERQGGEEKSDAGVAPSGSTS